MSIMRLEDTTSINGMIEKINEIIDVTNSNEQANEPCKEEKKSMNLEPETAAKEADLLFQGRDFNCYCPYCHKFIILNHKPCKGGDKETCECANQHVSKPESTVEEL